MLEGERQFHAVRGGLGVGGEEADGAARGERDTLAAGGQDAVGGRHDFPRRGRLRDSAAAAGPACGTASKPMTASNSSLPMDPDVAAVLMRDEGVVARDDNRGPVGGRHGSKRQAHSRARGGDRASRDPSQARDRAPSHESQRGQSQIVTGGPFITRIWSQKKNLFDTVRHRAHCEPHGAIRRTLVVVVGVFACAVHAVPASAQPQTGWDMALTAASSPRDLSIRCSPWAPSAVSRRASSCASTIRKAR